MNEDIVDLSREKSAEAFDDHSEALAAAAAIEIAQECGEDAGAGGSYRWPKAMPEPRTFSRPKSRTTTPR